MRKVLFLVFFLTSYFLILNSVSSAEEEQISILTYYPAPYGAYKNLYVSGNVGIGVTDPGTTLDVNGVLTMREMPLQTPPLLADKLGRIYYDSTAHAFRISENGGPYAGLGGGGGPWAINGNNIYYNPTPTGGVAIGSTDPFSCKLNVSTTSNYAINGSSDGVSGTINYGVSGYAAKGSNNIGVTGGCAGTANAIGVYALIGNSGTIPSGYYALVADAVTGLPGRYAGVFLNGNVGIGVTNPWSRLTVVSSTTDLAIIGVSTSTATTTIGVYGTSSSGTYKYGVAGVVASSGKCAGVYGSNKSIIGAVSRSYAGYFDGPLATTGGGENHVFDMAELIPCASDVESGDVVTINPEKDREAVKCSKEDDNSAAGVISESPQFSFGDREKAREAEPERNWSFLALAGQVQCKVDADLGEIKRGDLLTTSSTPGYAMKAKPIKIGDTEIVKPGTIVAKALEPLKKGKGKILVLVCLM